MPWTSLVVQGSRLCVSNAGSMGSIPDQGRLHMLCGVPHTPHKKNQHNRILHRQLKSKDKFILKLNNDIESCCIRKGNYKQHNSIYQG